MREPLLENDRLQHLRQMRMRLTVRKVLQKVLQAKKPLPIHARQEKLLLLVELPLEQVLVQLLPEDQAGLVPELHQADPELRALLLHALLPEMLQDPHPDPELQQEHRQLEARPEVQRHQGHLGERQRQALLPLTQAEPLVLPDQLPQVPGMAVEKKKQIREQVS